MECLMTEFVFESYVQIAPDQKVRPRVIYAFRMSLEQAAHSLERRSYNPEDRKKLCFGCNRCR